MYATPIGVDPNRVPVPFEKILGNTHRAHTRVQLERADQTIITQDLTILDGQVAVDQSAAVRRSCTLRIAPVQRDAVTGALRSVIPTIPGGDSLTPFGNMLRVFYGISSPTLPEVYWWPQGLFRLSSDDIDDDGAPTLQVTAYDLSRTIARNRLTTPYLVASGTNYGAAIIALATNRYPALRARAHAVTAVTGSTIVLDPEQDPWEVITAWATAAGSYVYFDTEGYLTIQPEPNQANDPIAWTYADAGDQRNALLLTAGRALSDEPGYNGVILTAESTTLTAPLRSEVWDLNPSSATYADGGYGRVPKFVSNPYVATQAQADAAARAELVRILGGTEKTSIAVVPNPAHEAGDVIRVVRPRAGIDQTTILESFTLPLSASGRMALSFRERRVTA